MATGSFSNARSSTIFRPEPLQRPHRRRGSLSSMRALGFLSVSAAPALFFSLSAALAQERTVAITVDDLPFAGGGAPADVSAFNLDLLAAFQVHHVPVTGFVIQKRVESLGLASGTRILKEWISRGF